MPTNAPTPAPAEAHTPGPWVVVPISRTEYGIKHRSEFCDGGQFATVRSLNRHTMEGNAQAEANAHMLAAAPAMYEALKAVLSVADRKTDEFDKARAALASARPTGSA